MRLILLLAGLAVALSAARASAVDIGVEPFAGVSAPVLQDDRTQGAIWGLRVPVNVVPMAPHQAIRYGVMGWAARPATSHELRGM